MRCCWRGSERPEKGKRGAWSSRAQQGSIIIPNAMPAPTNERQALERERQELPGQIVAYQTELDATPAESKTRREMLEWQIRRDRKRMAEIEARLTTG